VIRNDLLLVHLNVRGIRAAVCHAATVAERYGGGLHVVVAPTSSPEWCASVTGLLGAPPVGNWEDVFRASVFCAASGHRPRTRCVYRPGEQAFDTIVSLIGEGSCREVLITTCSTFPSRRARRLAGKIDGHLPVRIFAL